MTAKHKEASFFIDKALFSGLVSFKQLEKRITNLPEQERGNAFEVFAEAYLNTQKQSQAKEIWPFDAIPLSIRSQCGLSDRDMGVDGLLSTHTDEYHAYQVKYRSGRMPLSWQEISTFMGLSDRVDKRALFTNSESLPDLLRERSGFYVITGNDLDRLEKSDFQAIEQWLSFGQVTRIKKKPLAHQKEALRNIQAALEKENRTTAVMACGSGKTLISLWLAEQRNAQSILVLLPSLALVRQTLHCWANETSWDTFPFLCICSDPTVLKAGGDEIQLHQSDCDFPVTTSTADVEKFLDAKNTQRKIIFSTYQSCNIIPKDFSFDLGIFDEAHKTAGREGTNFAYALKDENVSIAKRLFLTATPRHYDVRKKDKEGDLRLVFSMDDASVYGQVCHALSFAQAAKEKIICQYKVLISLVTSDMVDRELLKRGEVIVKGDPVKAIRVANLLALTNAVERYGVKRIFTFHNSVKAAQSFTADSGEGIATFLNDFATFHVNGEMPTNKRELIMKEFKDVPRAVMSNARCLTEGVDVPAVDMVAFISPKKSQVDIVQATGRAMRNAPGKECGYVLIPIFLEVADGESLEQALEKTKFDDVWGVLQALQELDGSLVEIIAQMREDIGRTGGFDDSRLREKIEYVGAEIQLLVLRNAITTKIVENLGSTWDERFGELVKFKEVHGHCDVPDKDKQNKSLAIWVGSQRIKNRNKKLTIVQFNKLDLLGFDWDPDNTHWESRYKELIVFHKTFGHCNVPRSYGLSLSDQNPLASWVCTQRIFRKRGWVTEERIAKLNQINFDWDPKKTMWDIRFKELCEFHKTYKHCKVPQNYKQNKKLAVWVGEQRTRFKKHRLSQEELDKLNGLGFVWLTKKVTRKPWDTMFNELCKFKESYGHCNVPDKWEQNKSLAIWVGGQRSKKEKLTSERFNKLNQLGFDWDILKTKEEKRFAELVRFIQEKGHCKVTLNHTQNRFLVNWMNNKRAAYRKGELSQQDRNKFIKLGIKFFES